MARGRGQGNEHIPSARTPDMRLDPHGFYIWWQARSAEQKAEFIFPSNMDYLDAPGWDFRGANLHAVSLREANLEGADFAGASMLLADLSNATLRGANFTGADLTGASLVGAHAQEAVFDKARLGEASFELAHVDKASFYEVSEVDLKGSEGKSLGVGIILITLKGPCPERRIAYVKTVRQFTGLGLKEVKDMVDAHLSTNELRAQIHRDDYDDFIQAIADIEPQLSVEIIGDVATARPPLKATYQLKAKGSIDSGKKIPAIKHFRTLMTHGDSTPDLRDCKEIIYGLNDGEIHTITIYNPEKFQKIEAIRGLEECNISVTETGE